MFVPKVFAMLALACTAPPALAAAEEDRGLPAEFEGRVVYVGNYTGKASGLHDGRACPAGDRRCAAQTVGGGLRVRLDFRGEHVFGEYRSTDGVRGSHGLGNGTLVGRRTANGCQLFQADGTVWQGICDGRGFAGEMRSVAGAPRQAQVKFTTVGMHVHDIGRMRRLEEEAAARERRIAWLRTRAEGELPVQLRFQAAVELDSYGWWRGGIRPGTITAPAVVGKPKRGREYGLRSDFEFVGGGRASVTGRVRDGAILCLEYSMEPGNCQPVRPPRPVEVPSSDGQDADWWGAADTPEELTRP